MNEEEAKIFNEGRMSAMRDVLNMVGGFINESPQKDKTIQDYAHFVGNLYGQLRSIVPPEPPAQPEAQNQ